MSGMTIGSRVAATRPVIPSPNGTTARPIWWRSSPFVAASVSVEPVAVQQVQRRRRSARSASRVPSTTVSRSSSHVCAVVARRRSSWRNRSSCAGSRGGPASAVGASGQCSPAARAGVPGRHRTPRRGRFGPAPSPIIGHRAHGTSLGDRRYRSRLRHGTGTVPLQSNRNHRRLAAGVPLSASLTPCPASAARPRRAAPSTRARGSPPSPPSPRARASAAPATRSRARSACSARCSARSSPSRPAGPVRARRADPAADDRPAPRRPVLVLGARRGARAARRTRSPRSTSTRLAAVAKAFTLYFQLVNLAEERQRIRVLRTRSRRARGRADRRLHRRRGRAGCRRPAVADGRRGAARRGPSRSTRCSPRTPPRPAGARCSSPCAGSGGCWTQLDDPLTTPDEDADLRRRLREEISLLWHTGERARR